MINQLVQMIQTLALVVGGGFALFQWHFHFVYNEASISEAFWKNLGGYEEMNESYWKQSRDIAFQLNPLNK